mgnify:FL=1
MKTLCNFQIVSSFVANRVNHSDFGISTFGQFSNKETWAVLANFSSSTCQFWGFSRKKASSFVDEKFFYDLPLSLLGIYSVITARNFPPPPPLPKNLLDFSFKPKSTGIIIFILYSNDTKANLLKLVQCRKQIGKKNYSVVEGKMQFPTTPHILFFFSKYFPLSWNEIKMKSGFYYESANFNGDFYSRKGTH